MSAETITRALLCGFALCASGVVLAADDEVPDDDFLEYLGMWDESDEDWMILDDITVAENEERSDSVPDGEEPLETEDEN
ncbi:MAG: hypothetical protein KJN77_07480 [Gammaproteobacteria bacterium]|nr:hypothetical protein [Gammaproteobacteria bacterium]